MLYAQVSSGKCPAWLLEILTNPVDCDSLESSLKAVVAANESFLMKFKEVLFSFNQDVFLLIYAPAGSI